MLIFDPTVGDYVDADVRGYVEQLRRGDDAPTLDPAVRAFRDGGDLDDMLAANQKGDDEEAA